MRPALGRLIAERPRLALLVAAALGCLVLFALGFAVAPRASGEPAGATAAGAPSARVEPVAAAAPLRLGRVRSLGSLPALPAPKRRKPAPRRRPGSASRPPAVAPRPVAPRRVAPPRVAPRPAAPRPVAPPPVAAPPPGPPCIGAGCDY